MAIFKRLLRDKNGDIVIPAMSVSGDYYVATRVSTGQYSITSPFLPEPTDGMSIKVKFNYSSTSGTPSLSINGGTYNYIRTIGATTGTADTRTGAILNTSTIYEMTYNSSYGWIINNVHTNGEYLMYSSTDKVIGEWSDGKPIHRKTFYLSNFPMATAGSTYDVGTISNLAFPLRYDLFYSNSSHNLWYGIVCATGASQRTMGIQIDTTRNNMVCLTPWGDAWGSTILVLTIEYVANG